MKNIIKWLGLNNFKYEVITLTDGTRGAMVETDYRGSQPTSETYGKIDAIVKKCRRFKNIKTESRGHYTAVLITEINQGRA